MSLRHRSAVAAFLLAGAACGSGGFGTRDAGAPGTGGAQATGGQAGWGGPPAGGGFSGDVPGGGGIGGGAAQGQDASLSDADAGLPLCPERRLTQDYSTSPTDDLSALVGVTHVDGNLKISRTTRLIDLGGLGCLQAVQYDLVIADNAALGSLSGLEGVTSVGGGVSLARNPRLFDMTALSRVNSVGQNSATAAVEIVDNPRLEGIHLESLTTVAGSLWIDGNSRIVDLAGLMRLTAVGRQFFVRGNGALTTLRGLELLNSVGARRMPSVGVTIVDLEITDNPVLPQCLGQMLLNRLTTGGFMGVAKIERNAVNCP